MVVCLEAVGVPPAAGKGRLMELYAYVREELPGEGRGDTVRDSNHALEIVRKLVCDRIAEGRPPSGSQSLWQVEIQVMCVHKDTASYRAAYHKENGCPESAIKVMMAVYGTVKKVLRESLDAHRARRRAKA